MNPPPCPTAECAKHCAICLLRANAANRAYASGGRKRSSREPDTTISGPPRIEMKNRDLGAFRSLGTVGYIAPEQLRGQTADARSDLFAFGVVLYEMLSGKRAFQGVTPAETMSAILKEDPQELSETGRQIPPMLESIVRHCLEKNPARRFQSAQDVSFNLEQLSYSSGSVTVAGAAAAIRPRLRAWLILASLGVLALMGIAFMAGRLTKTQVF